MSTNLFQTQMPDITVLAGQTTSAAVDFQANYLDAEAISVQAPGTLPEVVTFQSSFDGTTWADIADSTATVIKGPTVSQTIIYNGVFTSIMFWRIKLGGAAGADRTFKLTKAWRG